MPRKSSRATASQRASSQQSQRDRSPRPSTSKSQHNGDTSELTQTRIDQHLNSSQSNFSDMVNNCVRYFVYNAGHNMYFRRSEIQKHCAPKAGQQFQQVIERATAILKNVYGYNLLVCDPTERSSRAYIISNRMPYVDYKVNRQEGDIKNVRKILILLILTHIYMSNYPITEASLYAFLANFDIHTNRRHSLFGQVKDYIMNILVKQKYLQVETDPVSKIVTFSWGIRAEKEISKHEVLKFVCKIFGDRQPKAWTNQYKAANEQGFENEKQTQNDHMEINDN